MNPLTIDCPQTGVWRAEIVNQWLPVDSFIGPWEVGLWETIINKLSRNRVFLKGEKWSGPAHALAPCTSTVVFFLLIARLLLLLHTLIWMGGHFHGHVAQVVEDVVEENEKKQRECAQRWNTQGCLPKNRMGKEKRFDKELVQFSSSSAIHLPIHPFTRFIENEVWPSNWGSDDRGRVGERGE